MDIYTLDFETYYSQDYSLSKMTTEEYVRDRQFEIIGLAIKKNNKSTKYVNDPGLIKRLLSHVDFSTSAILCHNTPCLMGQYLVGITVSNQKHGSTLCIWHVLCMAWRQVHLLKRWQNDMV